ncbi:MAG: hypothetical protein A2219_01100 [Elusimicrobia bacterium RIFOXYA2_FULL_50_26]|nr:MAG: hypothetical protein A2219_01100 [Elusimicrobia bacterium RIFOXYA2_FULL_50_26]OGS23410.1 MAG: hypothetical protein A2314_00630 [Elusimicrobia bacterium RIFOXYB2_FULL_50_12]
MKRIFDTFLVQRLKQMFAKVAHLNDTPEKIAAGFAIGAFIGVFPTFWLGGIITVALCALFRLNYVAGFAGSTIIMNPVTTPLFWLLSAAVGGLIFFGDVGTAMAAFRNHNGLNHWGGMALIYAAGNIIVSSVVAAVSYYVVLRIMRSKRGNK